MKNEDLAELKRLSGWFDRLYLAATDDRTRIAELERRVLELERDVVPDPDPKPSGLPLIPFIEPPLKRNVGGWDNNTDQKVSHVLLSNGTLRVSIAQGKQSKSRVIRRDFGLQNPAEDPGRGAYLREPKETLRRYELKVKIPENYSGKGELCTLGLKFHTHAARDPAYLAFIAWSTTTRWRINHPDQGGRKDYGEAPIKPGHTYQLAVEAFWSQGKEGRLRAWTDGVQHVNYKGPNYSKDEAKPPYLLTGAYFPSADAAFSETFEFSDLRVGDL